MGPRCWLVVVALWAVSMPAAAQELTFGDDEDYWVDGGEGGSRRSRVSVAGSRAVGATPALHTVRRGDTLWDITGHYFNSPWHWPRVWSYNPEITNPHWIYPLDRVRLRPESGAPAMLAQPSPNVPRARRRAAEGTVWLRDEGYLDRDALRASGEIVGSPEEQMLLSTHDEIYIRFDEGDDLRTGMQLTVFRRMRSEEREPEEEGVLVRVFGSVRLRSYDPDSHIGRAVITDALDPIERGYRVATMPRRFGMVPPRQNAQDLRARVVAALRPWRLLGEQQIIFVNVGSEQGVEVGNRFFVVREGDQWVANLPASEASVGATFTHRTAPSRFPREIIAEARVVNVRPRSSGLMVTRATAEVVYGDRAEMRSGY